LLITKETPLYKIASFMAAEKVYLLPVFEKDTVIGTISAEDIVKRLHHDENLALAVTDELVIDEPITIKMDAKVKDAYSLLRANSISELIVTDQEDQVCGIVSRSDIKH